MLLSYVPRVTSRRQSSYMLGIWEKNGRTEEGFQDVLSSIVFTVDDEPVLPAAIWAGFLCGLEEKTGYPAVPPVEREKVYKMLVELYVAEGSCSLATVAGANGFTAFILFYMLLRPQFPSFIECVRFMMRLYHTEVCFTLGAMRGFPFEDVPSLAVLPTHVLGLMMRDAYPGCFQQPRIMREDVLGRVLQVGDVVYTPQGGVSVVEEFVFGVTAAPLHADEGKIFHCDPEDVLRL